MTAMTCAHHNDNDLPYFSSYRAKQGSKGDRIYSRLHYKAFINASWNF